jgi:CRP-like cAMP-binding protein
MKKTADKKKIEGDTARDAAADAQPGESASEKVTVHQIADALALEGVIEGHEKESHIQQLTEAQEDHHSAETSTDASLKSTHSKTTTTTTNTTGKTAVVNKANNSVSVHNGVDLLPLEVPITDRAAASRAAAVAPPMQDSPLVPSIPTSATNSMGNLSGFVGVGDSMHSPSSAVFTPGKTTVPLMTTPLSASFLGLNTAAAAGAAGAASGSSGVLGTGKQANTVAQSIVRSTSAAYFPESAAAALENARGGSGRSGSTRSTANQSPIPAKNQEAHTTAPAAMTSPMSATTAATEGHHSEDDSSKKKSGAELRQNALEALQRAVTHVRASIRNDNAAALSSTGEGSEDAQTGNRIARAVRAVMRAAEMIDQEDVESQDEESEGEVDGEGDDDNRSVATTVTRHSHRPVDWRDDNSSIISPSTFFHDSDSVEVCSNRVMEYIIARGHAAQNDGDIKWLYRHSLLTSLLDDEDLNLLVPHSLHREYTAGETILDAGAPVQHVYVVAWGDVDVFRVDSLNSERKAMEGAFRLSSHQSAALRRSSRARSPSHGESLSSYGIGQDDGEQVKGSSVSGDGTSDAIYTHVGSLYPGQVFGIEDCVFNSASQYVFRAGSATSKTVLSLLPYHALQPALARNPRFAQGVGTCIVGSMDVFGPIREFCRYVFSPTSAQNEYLPLWSILESYTRIQNVIHTKLFSHTVDTGAWGYALNRLPDNVTSTFCFDLVHSLPPFVASRMRVEARAADTRKATDVSASTRTTRTAITYIRTKERRRCTWHLGMEGKTLVLLRDGFTDLLDFLTMLCVHIIESNKLRGRVQGMVHPPAIDILDEYLRQREQEELDGKYLTPEGISRDAEMMRVQNILKRMPLTAEEQAGLLRNWGHNCLLRIYEIMMHREEYNVRVDPSLSMKFQTNPFHEWALNLRGCVLEKLGLDRFSALPDNLYIDVVSSNTHCIKNLLCSFNRKYRKEILDYVRRKEGKRLGQPEEWHNVDDALYASLNGFLQNERPDLRDEYNRNLEENGITVLEDTAMTGLQVDVIPVHLLNFDMIDETIRESLHEYYEEVMKMGEPDGESGASFSKVPTWAQVCKPIWRRGSDMMHSAVPGYMKPFGEGDISASNAVHPAHAASNGAERSNTAHSNNNNNSSSNNNRNSSPVTETNPSTPSGGNSPQASPTGRHGKNGRLQHHFIINMDFAFGAQAEGICRVIFSAFGKRIRSVSVMGKAGGLTGKRGDIQLASHVLLSKSSLILEDNQDELRNCRNQDLTAERLRELAGPKVAVHHGKVLTVTGTMLQNVHLLRYYQQVWRCVGTEMEGSYFARVIEDFYRQGIAHSGLISRFAYYTSDLPLSQSDAELETRLKHKSAASAATLSAPMTPQEGVPPLYAIARGILENILL